MGKVGEANDYLESGQTGKKCQGLVEHDTPPLKHSEERCLPTCCPMDKLSEDHERCTTMHAR